MGRPFGPHSWNCRHPNRGVDCCKTNCVNTVTPLSHHCKCWETQRAFPPPMPSCFCSIGVEPLLSSHTGRSPAIGYSRMRPRSILWKTVIPSSWKWYTIKTALFHFHGLLISGLYILVLLIRFTYFSFQKYDWLFSAALWPVRLCLIIVVKYWFYVSYRMFCISCICWLVCCLLPGVGKVWLLLQSCFSFCGWGGM